MHIAHIAPEMSPFAKVGGLGDVVGSLPPGQARDGHQVTVVLPGYPSVLQKTGVHSLAGRSVAIPYDGGLIGGAVLETTYQGVQLLVLRHDQFFGRPGIYGEGGHSYPDNGLRFGWFCAAALEALRETVPAPDVIVAHDWPAAFSLVLLRALPKPLDHLEATAPVLVVHNLAHQGIFPLNFVKKFGVPDQFLDVDGMESLGQANWLKGAIQCASHVITVSPTYAREIIWPDYGEGLEETLLNRGDNLVGILNGLDTQYWNPATDPFLPSHFDAQNLQGKAACKEALQRELGLLVGAECPIFGIVSRIDPQKGIDLLESVAPWLVEERAQIIVLGTGQRAVIEPLLGLARIWKQSVSIIERFDEPLAHRIYAGSDFFLMPSRFEPCGLGQMVALRYGAIPVVRRTGGLADTVRDLDEHPEDGNGIVFEHADSNGLGWAAGRALNLFRNGPERLTQVRITGMNEDFSWDRSAHRYDEVLELAALRERRRVLI